MQVKMIYYIVEQTQSTLEVAKVLSLLNTFSYNPNIDINRIRDYYCHDEGS